MQILAVSCSGSDGPDTACSHSYCLFICPQAEGCLGSALKTVTSSESLVSGAAALFQPVSAACQGVT